MSTLAGIAERLAARGLDLCAPLGLDQYNAAVAPALRWDPFGREDAQALVVGNTRELWRVLRASPGALLGPNPVDRATEAGVREAMGGLRHAVRFAFEPSPNLLAAVSAAEVAGLVWRAPCQLGIHPVHGPWLALRALIVLDEPAAARGNPLQPVCTACDAACLPALREAMEGAALTHADVRNHWRRWLAVRDACPVGRASRYDDAALAYHYTHDPKTLEAT